MGANQVDIYRRTDKVSQVLEDRSVTGVKYVGITPDFNTLTSAEMWQISRTVFYTTGELVTHFANMAKYNCSWDARSSYFPALTGPTQAFPGEAINVGSVTIGTINVANNLNISGASGQLTIAANTEAKVGISRLTSRSLVELTPLDGDIYYSYVNPATSTNGTPLYKNQTVALPIGDAIALYIVPMSGTVKVAVNEVA